MEPRARRRMWLAARLVLFAVLAYIGVQVLMANSGELSGAATFLQHAGWGWIALATVAEAMSYAAFGLLQLRLLDAGGLRVGLGTLTALGLAGSAITNSLPGGGAFATVFAYRQLRREGAGDALSTWTIVAFTSLTAVTLGMLAVVGLVIAGSDSGVSGLWPLAAVLLLAPSLAVAVLLRPRLLRVLISRPLGWSHRLVGYPRGDVADIVDGLVTGLSTVSPGTTDWAFGLLYAGANWAADCSCLVLAFAAVGAPVPWRGLLVAYGAAQVAANLPITPGGLGIVEGSLTVALVAFGGSTVSTVAAVLLYRILSFWLVIVTGWGAWAGFAWRNRARAALAPQPVEVGAR